MKAQPFVLLLIFFCCCIPVSGFSELIDRSVAIVNSEIITLSEVNELGQPLYQKAAEEVPPERLPEIMEQIRTNVIEKLIDKKLMLQEAAKIQISVTDEEVSAALQRIIDSNNLTPAAFNEELQSIGMTEAMYREDLKGQILRSKLVNYEVRSKVIIPEEKIIDYYDVHYTDQVGEGGYYILQIGTTWKAAEQETKELARTSARKKIEKVHTLAKEGGDFQALARQYSDLPSADDGGDIGIFQEKEMATFMRRAVSNLKPGEISEIVEAPSGFQFFKLLSRQEGQIITKVPYDSVKEEIREKLQQQEMQSLYEQWMKNIREKAYIKIL